MGPSIRVGCVLRTVLKGSHRLCSEEPPGRCPAAQVSVNDFIVRATALALADVPRANSQWDAKAGEVVPCPGIDISIAVATDKGLITPIVKDANKKSLAQISAEVSPCPSCGSRQGLYP